MAPDTMNEKDIREKLEQLRADLVAVAETGSASAAIVELDQAKVGRLSRMDAMQAQAMARASGERRDAMLRRIDAALTRLDDDAYGYCRECEEAIDPRRLDFDPTTLYCIACASRKEV